MADDGPTQTAATWPLSTFSFRVNWDGVTFSFQEVSGLDDETQIIEYRAGNSNLFGSKKMPGLRKYGNITLKRGILKDEKEFWSKYNSIKMNSVKSSTVTIELLDEAGAPVMVWTLTGAFPTKISATDIKAARNEVAIEMIEFVHEGLSVATI